jgi:hypothetical protein
MNPSEFRINFVLSPELVLKKESLSSDFFEPGIHQINWFQQKTLNKTEPLSELDKVYINSHEYSKDVLGYAQKSAQTEEIAEGIKFSFSIQNNRKDFAEIDEEGKRGWLRQYLDDHILHYTIPAILEKSFNWDKDTDPADCEKFKKLHEAFKLALEKAYELKSTSFWIDGE